MKFKALAALLLAMLSIQSGASLAKHLFPVLGASGTTTLRIGLAAVILAVIFRPWRSSLNFSQMQKVLLYGSALGIMNLTFYLALERIPLGIAVALEFTGPLTVAVFSSRRKIDFLWVSLATLGILLVLPLSESTPALDPLGIAFALIAGACWALYILFGQKVGASISGPMASSLGMIVAALVVLPFGVVTQGANLLNLSTLPLAFAVALLSSAVPYSLEMIALRALPTQMFGVLMSLEPALAALSGLLFLKEHLLAQQWLAIALVMVASAGTSLTHEAPAVSSQSKEKVS